MLISSPEQKRKPEVSAQFFNARFALAVALLLLLHGCSIFQGDRPGRELSDAEIAAIPDAVPADEPPTVLGNPDSYEVDGKRYEVMREARGFVQQGVASWYGAKFHGRRTSSGEIYDMYKMTAAHKSLPLPSYVRVTNLENGKNIVVRVNDRGPFVNDRAIDLSYVAARKLGVVGNGTATVEIRAIYPGDQNHSDIVMRTVEDMQPLEVEHVTSSLPAGTPAVVVNKKPLPIVREAPSGKGYFVQVGAFSQIDNADRVRLQMEEYQSHRVTIVPHQGKRSLLHKVLIGPLASEIEAREVMSALRQKGHQQMQLVRE
jgi:rare lipoprotein A